ncbi:MAG: ABC transporter permease [Oscillatoriales cyanobacterium SM2_2_1]|nr:ABC transporter permease [Oscillatoriales cyanobacterium SM2_2_1]
MVSRTLLESFSTESGRYVELVHVLAERALVARYRGSILGVYWSVLSPVMMSVIYTGIFGTAFLQYYNNSYWHYALAVFTGMVTFNFFSGATSQALTSVVHNGGLLNKVKLPMSVFPVAIIVANCFQLVVGTLPLLAILTLWQTQNPLLVLALLLPLLAMVGVCLGMGLLVSGLYVFFRDLPYFYEIMVAVLSIATPLFYPPEIIPPRFGVILSLNPLAVIIQVVRGIVLEGVVAWDLMGTALMAGGLLLLLGLVMFQSWRSHYMDLL